MQRSIHCHCPASTTLLVGLPLKLGKTHPTVLPIRCNSRLFTPGTRALPMQPVGSQQKWLCCCKVLSCCCCCCCCCCCAQLTFSWRGNDRPRALERLHLHTVPASDGLRATSAVSAASRATGPLDPSCSIHADSSAVCSRCRRLISPITPLEERSDPGHNPGPTWY